MATSSIFSSIRITNPEQAEIFINALDVSARESNHKIVEEISYMTDKNEIRKFMAKRFPDLQ